MGLKSRNKGKAGERELANLLGEYLGVKLERCLEQTRDGGYDLRGLPGVALEVKRHAKATASVKAQWWAQTLEQARAAKLMPVLAYRLDQQQWTFVVLLSDVTRTALCEHHTIEMGLEAFCIWAREQLMAEPLCADSP